MLETHCGLRSATTRRRWPAPVVAPETDAYRAAVSTRPSRTGSRSPGAWSIRTVCVRPS